MEAYIVAGYRTAVGKAKRGGLRFYRPDDLAVDVIKGLMASVPQLDPKRVDDVIVGNAVPEAEQGLQVGSPDEIAYRQGWIDRAALAARGRLFGKTAYGKYLAAVATE